MSKDRLISSSILIVITIFAVINSWFFVVVLLGLTMGGLYEFFSLIKKKGVPIYSYTGILIGILIPISIFVKFELTKNWELFFIVIVLFLIFLMQFLRRENNNAIVGISTTLFGVLYVSWLFSFLIKIRYMLPGMEGVNLLAFIILVTKSGDVGALLIGSQFGRHPLLPRISPKKTVEGSIGSFLFSSCAAGLAKTFLPAELNFSLGHVFILGAFLGGIGQLGDLSESLIKRDCNVKDSGNLFKGLGGILDFIDSILFTTPVFYFYMSSLI